ncbi:unnamed protein product [Boreogadus saida]
MRDPDRPPSHLVESLTINLQDHQPSTINLQTHGTATGNESPPGCENIYMAWFQPSALQSCPLLPQAGPYMDFLMWYDITTRSVMQAHRVQDPAGRFWVRSPMPTV